MQNACPTSRTVLPGLMALSVLGSLAAAMVALLLGWRAGLGCYGVAVALCLAAVLHAAAFRTPSLVPLRS